VDWEGMPAEAVGDEVAEEATKEKVRRDTMTIYHMISGIK
jgi:hypothetical protein